MNALVDLFETARQLRSFGFNGDMHIPVSSAYAHLVLNDLQQEGDPTPTLVKLGATVRVEFRTHGTIILDIYRGDET